MTTLIIDEDYYLQALEIRQVLSQERFTWSGTNWLRKVEKNSQVFQLLTLQFMCKDTR